MSVEQNLSERNRQIVAEIDEMLQSRLDGDEEDSTKAEAQARQMAIFLMTNSHAMNVVDTMILQAFRDGMLAATGEQEPRVQLVSTPVLLKGDTNHG